MFKQKRAQTGETISWVIATVIIFVMMMFFVFGASLLGSTKKVLQHKDDLLDRSEELSYGNPFQKSVYTYHLVDDPLLEPRIKDYVINRSSYDFEENYEKLRRVLRE